MEALQDISSGQTVQAAPDALRADRIEELGRIIRAYSDVTDRLHHSHAQLQQTVQSLRNELSEKNRQLERRQRLAALGEMAAGMAHEIRNPLGGIQLYASMLGRDLAQMPASLGLVNKISAGVKRLEGLVSQVLQFAREIEAHTVNADLAHLVDESLELAGDRIASAKIRCRTQGPRPMPVQVDPRLMGQAVLNLLINGLEAAGEGGEVEIVWSAALSPETFSISISDSGPGIAPALMDRIFNPFFTTKETGTGLGLAIVHRIVEAHSGTITASNPPGGGAMFEIRI